VKKILVIEDCLQTQQILGKILQQSEAEVQCVATAADARQALSRGTPDMILLDLSLPDGDGFQLFSELRGEAATADVPVIFITGIS
jgi:DNA-binding response OmpR family regulator